jgi:hypothetical protein
LEGWAGRGTYGGMVLVFIQCPVPNKEHARPEPELQKDEENKQKKHHHDVSKECT